MMTSEIDHQREAKIAEEAGHPLECLEAMAELVVADLTDQGIAYETGDFQEMVEGRTVIERIFTKLLDGECICPAEEEE